MERFEVAKGYEDKEINIPKRSTAYSAGYDLEAAENIVIPPYYDLTNKMYSELAKEVLEDTGETKGINFLAKTLDEMSDFTKNAHLKLTLIPTGLKCKLDPNHYLKLVSRSSLPLKNWLICANSEGIIDSDYYGNPDNDGAIYFQVINLSPVPILIKKGDRICQAIVQEYITLDGDNADGERSGGFGSTGNE